MDCKTCSTTHDPQPNRPRSAVELRIAVTDLMSGDYQAPPLPAMFLEHKTNVTFMVGWIDMHGSWKRDTIREEEIHSPIRDNDCA